METAADRLTRTWDAEDRDAVRAAHAALWPRVRQELTGEAGSLYESSRFRESVRAMVLDGYGAEDVGVTFGVSRERARQWIARILSEEERERVGRSEYRMWDDEAERFVPVPLDRWRGARRRVQRVSRHATRVRKITRRIDQLRRCAEELGRVPSASEFLRWLGEGAHYPNVCRGFPGETYAECWDALYAAAGFDRRDGREARTGGNENDENNEEE